MWRNVFSIFRKRKNSNFLIFWSHKKLVKYVTPHWQGFHHFKCSLMTLELIINDGYFLIIMCLYAFDPSHKIWLIISRVISRLNSENFPYFHFWAQIVILCKIKNRIASVNSWIFTSEPYILSPILEKSRKPYIAWIRWNLGIHPWNHFVIFP